MPHNVSQTPKPLPRHQAAPAYSLPKGKVAIVAQNRMNKEDKNTKKMPKKTTTTIVNAKTDLKNTTKQKEEK